MVVPVVGVGISLGTALEGIAVAVEGAGAAAGAALGPIAAFLSIFALTGDSESPAMQEKMRDEMAHTPKKQSTGSTSKGTAKANKHAKQYRHGGKNRQKNPNQRKGAERRKNKGR